MQLQKRHKVELGLLKAELATVHQQLTSLALQPPSPPGLEAIDNDHKQAIAALQSEHERHLTELKSELATAKASASAASSCGSTCMFLSRVDR